MFNLSQFENIIAQVNKIYFSYHLPGKKLLYVTPNVDLIWERNIDLSKDDLSFLMETIKKEDRVFVTDMIAQFTKEVFKDNLEFSIELPDNRFKLVSCQVSSMANDQGAIEWIGGFMEDITERKKYEMSLYEYSARKSSLLEILQHDLVGHLNLLKNIAVSFTEKNIQNNLDKLNTYANSIHELCNNSMAMISDLVQREFADNSLVPIKKSRVEVVKRVQSILAIFKSSEALMGKVIEFKTSKEKIYAEIDDIKFMQVLNNLLYNAVKFTREDGCIEVSIEDQDSSILFTIKDNGIGIPSMYHPVIFQEHTPASRVGLKGEKTNGLGLAIAKKMIDLHQGKIWFESQEGEGSVFYFSIPKKMKVV